MKVPPFSRPAQSTDCLYLRPARTPAVRHGADLAGSRKNRSSAEVSASGQLKFGYQGHATHRLPGPSEPWATGAVLWPAFATAPSTARAHLVRVPLTVPPREQ